MVTINPANERIKLMALTGELIERLITNVSIKDIT